MKATERPGAAHVTATPRPVIAPRQMNLPSLQDVREAPFGAEHSPFSCQPATSVRPRSQETPVTRTSPLEPLPSQALALTPSGASCPGVVEVEAGGAVGSLAPVVSSEEEPQPAATIATTMASAASTIAFGLGSGIGAKSSGRARGRGRSRRRACARSGGR